MEADSKRVLLEITRPDSSDTFGGKYKPEFVVFDATTGKEAFCLKQTDALIDAKTWIANGEAIFSPDGKYLAISWIPLNMVAQSVVLLCDAVTGKRIQTFVWDPAVLGRIPETGKGNPFRTTRLNHRMAFSPDGRRFAGVAQWVISRWGWGAGVGVGVEGPGGGLRRVRSKSGMW